MRTPILLLSVFICPWVLTADSVDYIHVTVAETQADASSALVEPKKPETFYQPRHAFDGKVETAWCEGQEGSGIGEWVRADFKPKKAVGIAILNGYGKFKDKYRSNNRVKKLRVILKLADGGEKKLELSLKDNTCGWDDAGGKISSPEEACAEGHGDKKTAGFKSCVARVRNECMMDTYSGGGESFFFKKRLTIKSIRAEIVDIYKGEKHDDTCIADIRLIETSGNVESDFFKNDKKIKRRY